MITIQFLTLWVENPILNFDLLDQWFARDEIKGRALKL